ncbi:MAG: hypothetical protein KIA12_05740 [Varibaculum cambriense]|nr:hypothetical protein [Varibaculum cambriense]
MNQRLDFPLAVCGRGECVFEVTTAYGYSISPVGKRGNFSGDAPEQLTVIE